MRALASALPLALVLAGCATAPGTSLPMADRFTPAPAAVPRTGPTLALGKCINLSNMLDAPKEGDWGRAFEDADIGRIAAKGFTAIRLPARFDSHALEVPPYTIEPAFLERVAHIVDLATARGLKIIVDLHHYPKLDAEPLAQVDRFAAIWRQLAARFQDAPPTVVFELDNEPHDRFDATNLLAVFGSALAEVRRTNPTRTVIIDGPRWAGIDDMLTSPFPDDPYVVPTFHYYQPENFSFPEAAWRKPTSRDDYGRPEDLALIEADLAKVRGYIERTGRVPFVGEYGAWVTRPVAEREEYYETISEAWASIGIDTCAWGFANTFELWDSKKGAWIGRIADRIASPVRD